ASALSFLRCRGRRPARLRLLAAVVTILADTGVMISWMEGFRRAYGMQNTWGFWRERAVAIYLVFLALLPLGFSTLLVVFGDEIEIWIQREAMHIFRPLVWLVFMLIR